MAKRLTIEELTRRYKSNEISVRTFLRKLQEIRHKEQLAKETHKKAGEQNDK